MLPIRVRFELFKYNAGLGDVKRKHVSPFGVL